MSTDTPAGGPAFVDSGSARIAYDVQGSGPDVLLMHAGVTDRRSWQPLIHHLGGRFRTVAYDRRGFGETTYRPEPHLEPLDTLSVLDAVGAHAAIVVGASNGGRRAVDLALAHPERVHSLVLVGAGVSGAPELDETVFSADVQALVARYEAADEGGDLDLLNRIEAHAWLDGWTAPEGRVSGPVRDLFLAMNGNALRSPDPGPEQQPEPAWDRLAEISVPTLVLCGDLDAISLPASEHLAANIPGATYEVLEGTGHLPHLEAHARTLEAIAAFLDASA
ncbi:alpha/beta hydrolase [soil metagenome]